MFQYVLWYNKLRGNRLKITDVVKLIITLSVPFFMIASLMYSNNIVTHTRLTRTLVLCFALFIGFKRSTDIKHFGCVWDDVLRAMNGGIFCDIFTIRFVFLVVHVLD